MSAPGFNSTAAGNDPAGMRRAVTPLALGFLLLLLPQLERLPLWLGAVAVLACLWGVGHHRRWWRPFSRPLRFVVMLGLVGLFVATHFRQLTVDTAAAFFVLTVALKWTELERPRDVFVMVMILCYLGAVSFLFEQGIFWSLGIILAVLILFGSLQVLSAAGAHVARLDAWKRLGWTLLKVVPVVVVLFLIFPRIGPLWSVPLVNDRGSAGLSESMTPGDFTDLGRSSEPAFRVTFGGPTPPVSMRYWRGLILDHFDGRTWSRTEGSSGARIGRVNQSQGGGTLADDAYEVLMEPSYQTWAFALEGSQPLTSNISMTRHGLVEFDRPVDTTVRYRMQRGTGDGIAPLDNEMRERYTALPAGYNPRTRRWARELTAAAGSDRALVQTVMQQFRVEPFYYTLQPAALGKHSIDEFLFQTREGFCAHYAGAATFVLRAAGIPARVIGGYLGGEPGLNDEYLVVRQYDAHAWIEVWLEESGWVRLDPTAMVAPERVQEGWRDALASGDSGGSWAEAGGYRGLALWDWAGLRLDAVNYYWQRFVVDYQSDTQRSLFGKFPGSPDLAALGYWTAGFVAAAVGVAGLLMIRRERPRSRDPLSRYTLGWQAWLKRRSLLTSAGEPPLQQAERAARRFPRHRAAVMAFARALNAALYDPDPTTAATDIERRWQALEKVPRRAPAETRTAPRRRLG